MKKFIYILAAAAAVFACSKEIETEVKPDIETKGEVHELFVSLPEVTDVDTKATIATSDGTFKWTAGDAIAVVTSTSDTYKFVAETGNSNTVRFTYTGEMNGTPATIHYPWKDSAPYYEESLPSEINGLTGALSGDYIRLTGTVSENSATLSYRNAFLKVTFTNVPTFAKTMFFDGTANDVTITGISLAAKGEVTAYIPVSASNTGFTVSLKDNNSNTIIARATTTAKTFTNGTIKNMKPVAVGHVITINDSASKNWTELAIWKNSDDTKNYRFKTGNSYPSKLNSLSSGTYYVVLNTHESGLTWAVEGVDLAVSYEANEGGYSCSTSCVYLYRDLTFSTPSSGTYLVGNYRIYPSCQYNTYSDPCIYVYDAEDKHPAGDWPGTHLTKSSSVDSSIYYEFDSKYSNSSDITIIFSNNGGNQMSDWKPTINRDYTYQYW